MNNFIEGILENSNKLEQVEWEIKSLNETIKRLDEISAYIKCSIEFSGKYTRASKTIYLSIPETIELLITRRENEIKKRDFLITKLNSFL